VSESRIKVLLCLPDGDVEVPGGKVTVLYRGQPEWTGEVMQVNTSTVRVRVFNSDRTWWEDLFPPRRLRKAV